MQPCMDPTGMMGAADLSVTGKILSVTGKLCNWLACCQHWDGGSSRSLCNQKILSVTRFFKQPGSVWLIHLYFLPVNRSGWLCNWLRRSTLVNEGCVAGTQWVGSVTGIVGSIKSVAWTASWSNFYNRFPVGPSSVTGW